jgi:hypothetical protein
VKPRSNVRTRRYSHVVDIIHLAEFEALTRANRFELGMVSDDGIARIKGGQGI